jgi:hypothetical protein
MSEAPNGIVPFVPLRALVPVPAVIEQVTDPQVLAALIHDGGWRTAAEWRELCAALQLRQCGEDAALEARVILHR